MSHLTSKFKSTPTFTFKSRNQTITSSNRPEMRPSPSQYEANQLEMSRLPKQFGRFGKASRIKDKDSHNEYLPGPGAYQSSSSINLGSFHKGQTLRKGPKRFPNQQKITPAPNLYPSPATQGTNAPKYSFFKEKRQKAHVRSFSLMPSPNAYNPNTPDPSSSFSIGRAKRRENILPTRSPGPGQYSQQRQFVSKSFNQQSQVLSRAKRLASSINLAHVPAPNAYSSLSFIQQNAKKQRGFTAQRRYSCKLLQTPSPQTYNTDTLINRYNVKVGFARAQRAFLVSQLRRSGSTPGPGSHQIQEATLSMLKSTNVSKFSKEKLSRLLDQKPTNKLGFLDPEKLDQGKPNVPKFSIPSARARAEAPNSLVDRFYDASLPKSSSGSFKIPQQKRLQSIQMSDVGPGSYNPQAIASQSTKKLKFSKEKRKTFLDEAIQGKLKIFINQSHSERQQFPNPPKYMNVHKKLSINDKALGKY